MRLVYVSSRYPYGPGEAFLGAEIAAHVADGASVHVMPAYPKGAVVHGDAAAIAGLVETRSAAADLVALARHVLVAPRALASVGATLAAPQRRAVRAKNLAVLSRAGRLVSLLRRTGAEHVHVHWGGTSSTLAMVAAEVAGVPWSLTLHRWDIYENNLLARKVRSASFTRVISEGAAADLRTIVPDAEPTVLHMGVDIPSRASGGDDPGRPCRFVCVASLVAVKNHGELLRAFAEVPGEASLDLIGAGPLEVELRSLASSLGVADRVRFAGLVEHDQLLGRLAAGEWDGIVLASMASGSEHEGIPVSLMEAMAAGLPPVATDSGGTRELVTADAGILVPPGDHAALSEALRRFAQDGALRARLADGAARRVADAFDARRVARELRELFSAAGR